MHLSEDANTIYKGRNIRHFAQASQIIDGSRKTTGNQSWSKEFLTLKEVTMSELDDYQKTN